MYEISNFISVEVASSTTGFRPLNTTKTFYRKQKADLISTVPRCMHSYIKVWDTEGETQRERERESTERERESQRHTQRETPEAFAETSAEASAKASCKP